MWLPNAFYDRVPQYWMFVGVLLIILGLYLGFEMNNAFMFIGAAAGAASFLWGLRVYLRRSGKSDTVKSVGRTVTTD